MLLLLALTLLLAGPGLATAQLQTDRFGTTTGRIGGAPVQGLTRNGMTTGRIGERGFQVQTDRFGNTTGRIGDAPVIGQRDALGNTRGTVGGRPFSCTANGMGGQTCR
ncbi:hypothetical protein EJV46_18565 [Roseococcus sp. SYP-B2431]|uniref:hypothetical protein n=1 Tax=Roseococcus sp. SYP-B2431 TaxID=2496640 RepID=UPI001038B4BF|nr:hypothetical protein [Roseococcus sp. SYP-B2431]TCH96593.1 hypothetical protein EJV46_18565 [Roseococcus sp. SYP-B2431]